MVSEAATERDSTFDWFHNASQERSNSWDAPVGTNVRADDILLERIRTAHLERRSADARCDCCGCWRFVECETLKGSETYARQVGIALEWTRWDGIPTPRKRRSKSFTLIGYRKRIQQPLACFEHPNARISRVHPFLFIGSWTNEGVHSCLSDWSTKFVHFSKQAKSRHPREARCPIISKLQFSKLNSVTLVAFAKKDGLRQRQRGRLCAASCGCG